MPVEDAKFAIPTHYITSLGKVINRLDRHGYLVDGEANGNLSPYRIEHIKLLGAFSLKI